MCSIAGEEKKHWEYSFDLIQKRLETVYSATNPQNAYREIEKYLFAHGFSDTEQKQGSCYFTLEQMTFSEVDRIVRDIFHRLPWLSECIRKDALYERPEIYTYENYRSKLNNTLTHKIELEQYYEKKGKKVPLNFNMELAARKVVGDTSEHIKNSREHTR